MNPLPTTPDTDSTQQLLHRPDVAVPVLLAQVYDAAPAPERTRLLTQLMQPLGVLSLVAVAGGVFARLRFRDAPGPLNLRLEDTLLIGAEEVRALAEHAQQVSVETVDALRLWLTQGPVLAGSAAALLLVQLLKRRAAQRRGEDRLPPERG
ncbi:MAG: hypothetical protein CFE40_03735 [Burkholderiales bacterium PBB1]|nr:MAG: hypothetical protein CFE40_03735 [Burkholderiales bacterium PBB1]